MFGWTERSPADKLVAWLEAKHLSRAQHWQLHHKYHKICIQYSNSAINEYSAVQISAIIKGYRYFFGSIRTLKVIILKVRSIFYTRNSSWCEGRNRGSGLHQHTAWLSTTIVNSRIPHLTQKIAFFWSILYSIIGTYFYLWSSGWFSWKIWNSYCQKIETLVIYIKNMI